MSNDLDAPLTGKKKRFPFSFKKSPKKGAKRRAASSNATARFPITSILVSIVVLLVGGITLRIILVDDPMSGRPIANVDISSAKNTNPVASEVAAPPTVFQQPNISAPGVANSSQQTGPLITNVDDALAQQNNAPEQSRIGVQALSQLGVDPDLVEETANGPIPHVGPGGKTPAATYARASITPATANGHPLVAIVVTGLGLNEASTLDAIERLPDNVTLAFAPYGRSLHRTTAQAREQGHEMLLQVPLEPFDYPENDPGPQTLLTGQAPRANLDKLFWIMARFGGYYGVMNHMGARFTAEAADFGPVLEELGTRGLAYFDDNSSNRSIAAQLAQNNKVPFARAFKTLDNNPSRPAILTALENIEAEAKLNGSAIGVISALPISIQIISEWANALEDRGFVLVPASALMTKP